ncbi:hypothetical protein EK21DRAFT_53031 [Setomelanomma holmii]|uniref:Uncharacterized protein n=1 Tax=Setomelanomma holmii TaxID=210430 RepID=A0A9P4LV60_9PLEO|nr:hypothetical protein EK21DRAFT_53031 [Setomelanomma holmii]
MKSEPTPTYPPYAAAGPPNPYAQAHAAAPPAPIDPRPVNQQYRSHAAPAFAPAPAPPQFATFERPSKPVNEDALPAMPSWSDACDTHVEVEQPAVPPRRGDVEMDRLNHNGSATSGSMTGMAAAGARRSPAPARSPVSPVGNDYGYNQGFENESLVGATPQRSPHSSPITYGRPFAQQDGYRRGSPAQNLSPVYGAGDAYNRNEPYGRHSPAQPQSYNQYDQHDQYDHHDAYSTAPPTYRSASPPQQNTYMANPYHDHAPSSVQHHQPSSLTPGYAELSTASEPSELSRAPVSAYPGQRSYTPQTSYPGQTSYQAFNPGQTGQQFSGVQRKGVEGSYRDI